MIANRDIDVISSHTKDGKIRPMRFRMIDDTGNTMVIDVGQVGFAERRGDKKNPIMAYSCRSVIDDCMKSYELHFAPMDCK